MGTVLYFVLFPEQYSGIFNLGSLTGTEQVIHIANPLQFCVICVLAAAVCIPIQVLELGEEIGWREYLLPKQIAEYGVWSEKRNIAEWSLLGNRPFVGKL